MTTLNLLSGPCEEKSAHPYESTKGGSCPVVELSMIELFQKGSYCSDAPALNG